MSSTVAVRRGEVVSQTPMSPPAPVNLDGRPMVEHRLVPSNFRLQDGLNWPRRLVDSAGTDEVYEMDFGKFRLNPKLEPKRFEIGR
jgi:hypothetical protein